jgi:amidase
MPLGLMVIGRRLCDARLLATAQAIEMAFADLPDLKRPLPEMQSLLMARPELKSIVTHPSEWAGSGNSRVGVTRVS